MTLRFFSAGGRLLALRVSWLPMNCYSAPSIKIRKLYSTISAQSQKVINYALTDLDIVSALAGKPGFISVSQALLMSDVIRRLPKQGVVLEIPETVEFTPEVIARCRDLRQSGYTLALDHVAALTEFPACGPALYLGGENRCAGSVPG